VHSSTSFRFIDGRHKKIKKTFTGQQDATGTRPPKGPESNEVRRLERRVAVLRYSEKRSGTREDWVEKYQRSGGRAAIVNRMC